MTTEDRQLLRIAGDLRLVGAILAVLGVLVILATLGLLVSLGAAPSRRGGFGVQTIGAAGVLILLLPGGWFFAAASLILGGRGSRIVTWSLRVVALQVAACVVAVGLTAYSTYRRNDVPAALPAMLLMFFAPAQSALIWQLVRARRLIDARDARRGFAMAEARVAEIVALPVDVDASSIPIATARDEARTT